MLALLGLSRVHTNDSLTQRGNRGSCLFLKPLPRICALDTEICAYSIIILRSKAKYDNGNNLNYSTKIP